MAEPTVHSTGCSWSPNLLRACQGIPPDNINALCVNGGRCSFCSSWLSGSRLLRCCFALFSTCSGFGKPTTDADGELGNASLVDRRSSGIHALEESGASARRANDTLGHADLQSDEIALWIALHDRFTDVPSRNQLFEQLRLNCGVHRIKHAWIHRRKCATEIRFDAIIFKKCCIENEFTQYKFNYCINEVLQ